MVIVDALSRAPLLAPDQHNKHLEEDVQAYVDVIVHDLSATKQRVEEIRCALENDPFDQVVARYCREGQPKKG